MLPYYFSNAKNRNVKNKRDIEGGTWLRTMCPHASKKRSKALAKSSRTKQSCKSSYTIPKKPLEERCDKRAKAETNVFRFKVTSILGWKSSTKGGNQL